MTAVKLVRNVKRKLPLCGKNGKQMLQFPQLPFVEEILGKENFAPNLTFQSPTSACEDQTESWSIYVRHRFHILHNIKQTTVPIFWLPPSFSKDRFKVSCLGSNFKENIFIFLDGRSLKHTEYRVRKSKGWHNSIKIVMSHTSSIQHEIL